MSLASTPSNSVAGLQAGMSGLALTPGTTPTASTATPTLPGATPTHPMAPPPASLAAGGSTPAMASPLVQPNFSSVGATPSPVTLGGATTIPTATGATPFYQSPVMTGGLPPSLDMTPGASPAGAGAKVPAPLSGPSKNISILAIAYSRYRSITTIDIDSLLRSTRMRWESDFRIRCTVHICMCVDGAHIGWSMTSVSSLAELIMK